MKTNTPTTPASVAARMTDKWIKTTAENFDNEGYFYIAAVLRDYVRLRRLTKEIIHKYNVMVNSRVTATINGTEYYQPFNASEVNEIKRLLAEADKGEEK